MRNLRELITLVFLFLSITRMNGQCPTAGFQVSDTICPAQPLQINNAGSAAIRFNWDFCLGDLDSLPTVTAAPSPGSVSYPQNMKIVEENGNYYGFIANAGYNYLTRLDFGNSPANTPTAVTLSSDPLLSQFQSGIDLVKEGNKWLIFVTMFSSNGLVRLDLDSITQTTPVITNIAVSGLFNPNSIKLIEGYGFVTNNQAADIVRLDFGGSYLNTPTVLTPSISTLAFNNFGIDIAYDCTTGTYTGFTTSYGFGTLSKIEFGNSLSNNPTVTGVGTGLWGAQGVNIIREKGDWHLFMVANTNLFTHYKLGASLSNALTLDYSSNFGGVMADPKSIQMIKIGSNWMGISSNTGLFSFVRHVFPQGCLTGSSASTLQSPSSISYAQGTNGYQYFELTETYPNGSTAQFIDSVYVTILPPVAGFTASAACKNATTSFTDGSTVCFGNITDWAWDFGDGFTSTSANPDHIYTTAGTFNVTLTVTGSTGLTDTFTQTIQVNDAPAAWFSIPVSACAGSEVPVTDSSTANAGSLSGWVWNLGDTTSATGPFINHPYQHPGTYAITLIVSTDVGCTDTTTRSINILPGPFASYTIANTCIGETVAFNNTSVSPGTLIQTHAWDFGDGNTSTSQNPQHAYPLVTAQYNVQLICTATNGCADTLIQEVQIGNKPLPYFTSSDDTACSYSVVQFTDGSAPAAGDTIIQRFWDFGDGTFDSTSVSPSHSYSSPGLYTVRLTVKSPVDCDSTYTYSIYIIESPSANFSINNACEGNPHNFNDLSTAPAGSSINYWSWDFGNSATSGQPSVVYTYPDTGTYQVTLIVRSNIGCYDTLTAPATVYKIPVANFIFPRICTDQPVVFTDSSYVEGSVISSWNWNFGTSGVTSTMQNPTAGFPDALAYPVTMIVSSAYGCTDTITKMAAVFQSPEFNISTPDHCFGKNQFMSVNVTSGNLGNLSYLWNFGDSTASFLANPFHSYPNAGQYITSLQITDISNGCEVIITDTIQVNALPEADFTYTGQCQSAVVHLNDSSTIASGIINTWNWTLGTSGTSGLQNPTAIFMMDGVQQIKLVVVSEFGCKDSITKNLIIRPKPTAGFVNTPEYGAPPLAVNFTNTSDSGTYTWDFGDSSPVYTGNNPSHIYSDTGTYTAILTVVSPFGCTNQFSNDIYVLIPQRDLAINGISYIKENNKWLMKAIVANFGNEDAYTFELKAQLNNEALFYNTFDADTLRAGTFREYTFNTMLDASQDLTPAFFCAEIVSVNHQKDMNPANDRFCISSTSGFDVISIYPNPADETIFLGLHSDIAATALIEIYQSDGKRIMTERSFAVAQGLNTLTLDISELSSGLYVINVRSGEAEKSLRIVRK